MKIAQSATSDWNNWFAWHPVRTENGEWVWLETVERKWYHARIPNVMPSSWYIYRRIDNKPSNLNFSL